MSNDAKLRFWAPRRRPTQQSGADPDAVKWGELQQEFRELSELFTNMRLETKEEAVGKSAMSTSKAGRSVWEWEDQGPKWYDGEDDVKVSVKPWLMIPYVDALDQSTLKNLLEFGQSLIPLLEERIAARELSVEFLVDWGRFCAVSGALELVYGSKTDIGRLREARGEAFIILRSTRDGSLIMLSALSKGMVLKRWRSS